MVEYITGAEAVDEYTLKLTFSKPYAEWERMTLQSWGEPMMVSPAQVKKTGNEKFADAPVGTGPFKFVENVPGDRIVLERFKDYWGPQANVDKLVFRRLDDPAARVAALRTGEVDFILAPPPDEVEALRKDKFQVMQSNAPHIWYWHLNMKDDKFKDVRVRKALQMAVDKEKMCKELLRGTAKPAWSMISPATAAYDASYKPYSYNPDKAKALLKEAGLGNGFETTFWTSTSGSGQMIPVPMAEWIQRDLAKVGIKVKLETFDWITYLSKMFQGLRPGHGAYQLSWGMTSNFWIDIVARSTRQPDKGVNVGWYANPKVDGLLDSARGRARRQEARRDLQADRPDHHGGGRRVLPHLQRPEPGGPEPEGEGLREPARGVVPALDPLGRGLGRRSRETDAARERPRSERSGRRGPASPRRTGRRARARG